MQHVETQKTLEIYKVKCITWPINKDTSVKYTDFVFWFSYSGTVA